MNGTLDNLTNEKESAFICKGNFTAKNVVNTGNIQVKNMTMAESTSFTNDDDATVKVDNSLTLKGSANNYGFVEVNGNSQIKTIRNTADLKLNGTAEFEKEVINTGKIQVTSYGATFNDVENSGEISVAGTIASNGTVTNAYYPCTVAPVEDSSSSHMLESLLKACRKSGMKLFIGLNATSEWFLGS